jgi:hypothetical protein
MTQTDWHQLIETSFDEGPGVRSTPRDDVVAGQRALRRHRARVAGLSGGAVLLTSALVATVMSLGGSPAAPERASEAPPATTVQDSPQVIEPSRGTASETREVYRTAVGPLYLDRDTGFLDLPEGWRELDRVLDPFGPGSIALSITKGDGPVFLASNGRTRGILMIAMRNGDTTFQEFVDAARDDLDRVQDQGAE